MINFDALPTTSPARHGNELMEEGREGDTSRAR